MLKYGVFLNMTRKIKYRDRDYIRVKRFKDEKTAEKYGELLEKQNEDKAKRFPVYLEEVVGRFGRMKIIRWDVYIPTDWEI